MGLLYVYNNPKTEKVSRNLVLGNMIFDIGENGKILDVEIDCTSKFFKFPLEQLISL